MTIEDEIVEIVNRETNAWNSKDTELLLSIFHEDMVWVWPEANFEHDPIKWKIGMGRYNHERWGKFYKSFLCKIALEKESLG